jgi:uncharacterized protein
VESPKVGEELPPVRITFPDGMVARSDHADINGLLSRALGREVKLSKAVVKPYLEEYWPELEGLTHTDTVTNEAMPEGTFFDCAVVHVLTTSTADFLRRAYPQRRFEVRRFRPNIVLQSSSEGMEPIEGDWNGKPLEIGSEIRLNVTGPCPRCVMTTLAQGDLPQDLGILKTVVKHNKGNVGAYAAVAKAGSVIRGDSAHLEALTTAA